MELNQSQPTNISWPELYITAESSNEPFQDMRVITAKSELLIQARSEAVAQLLQHHKPVTDTAVDKIAAQLINTKQIQVFESASVSDEGSVVCMDVDIIDDDAIFKALDMIYEAVTSGGTWTSTKPISYTWESLINAE